MGLTNKEKNPGNFYHLRNFFFVPFITCRGPDNSWNAILLKNPMRGVFFSFFFLKKLDASPHLFKRHCPSIHRPQCHQLADPTNWQIQRILRSINCQIQPISRSNQLVNPSLGRSIQLLDPFNCQIQPFSRSNQLVGRTNW